jgi:hypothetical protein
VRTSFIAVWIPVTVVPLRKPTAYRVASQSFRLALRLDFWLLRRRLEQTDLFEFVGKTCTV